MDLKRATVVNFDGDPFMINFWLMNYQKKWCGEVDKIYLLMGYNPGIATDEIRKYNKKLLNKFPEIEVFSFERIVIPEEANKILLERVKEDSVVLSESDAYVMEGGFVNASFNLIETGEADMVASEYRLIEPSLEDGFIGFSRTFCFAKTAHLLNTDLDFYPRTTEGRNLDCFGWMTLQLYKLKPRIIYYKSYPPVEGNIFKTQPIFHVRQMSSSVIGMGGGSQDYLGFKNKNEKYIEEIKKVVSANNAAEWIYVKAIAFKQLMVDFLEDKKGIEGFAKEYQELLNYIIEVLGLPKEKIEKIRSYYRDKFKE